MMYRWRVHWTDAKGRKGDSTLGGDTYEGGRELVLDFVARIRRRGDEPGRVEPLHDEQGR